MSTYFPKPGEIVRKWYVVDADGQTLGRMASQVARVLMGKENPQYTPFLDTGDHVIVINAEKVKTTGMKSEQKQYHHYTGATRAVCGLRITASVWRASRKELLKTRCAACCRRTSWRITVLSKLQVYKGDKHPARGGRNRRS